MNITDAAGKQMKSKGFLKFSRTSMRLNSFLKIINEIEMVEMIKVIEMREMKIMMVVYLLQASACAQRPGRWYG